MQNGGPYFSVVWPRTINSKRLGAKEEDNGTIGKAKREPWRLNGLALLSILFSLLRRRPFACISARWLGHYSAVASWLGMCNFRWLRCKNENEKTRRGRRNGLPTSFMISPWIITFSAHLWRRDNRRSQEEGEISEWISAGHPRSRRLEQAEQEGKERDHWPNNGIPHLTNIVAHSTPNRIAAPHDYRFHFCLLNSSFYSPINSL